MNRSVSFLALLCLFGVIVAGCMPLLATQKHTEPVTDPHFAYGYHWFTVPGIGDYAALGSGGQIILVIPESDLVIVSTANTEESIFELIEKYVLPSVRKSQ
jgi:CubicO group peptidase (beta-lactamase class C family)